MIVVVCVMGAIALVLGGFVIDLRGEITRLKAAPPIQIVDPALLEQIAFLKRRVRWLNRLNNALEPQEFGGF